MWTDLAPDYATDYATNYAKASLVRKASSVKRRFVGAGRIPLLKREGSLVEVVCKYHTFPSPSRRGARVRRYGISGMTGYLLHS